MITCTVIAIISIIWFLTGELGFCIWRSKVLEARKPKNVNILAQKHKFGMAGLIGLIYALKYKG
jgi:hypothetical protein